MEAKEECCIIFLIYCQKTSDFLPIYEGSFYYEGSDTHLEN